MRAVWHRGLNCHLASVVTAAAALGIEHERAYAALWSETGFGYDAARRIRTSKRVYIHLEALGLRMEEILLSGGSNNTDGAFSDCCVSAAEAVCAASARGGMLLAGMDSADVPWSPVYGGEGGVHYFIARGDGAGGFACCDPVYGAEDAWLDARRLLARAFELRRVYAAGAKPPQFDAVSEARAVLRGHPPLMEKLTAEISACGGEGRGRIAPLSEYISAMVNNRYLFERFLRAFPSEAGVPGIVFGNGFLARWEAVKHGLIKASVLKQNSAVLEEACGMLASLMREETDAADAVVCQSGGEHII